MFIDDFFLLCILDNFSRVTDLCIKTNLVLNFEKCHFMVHEGIVLVHLVSSRGIEEIRPTSMLLLLFLTPPL